MGGANTTSVPSTTPSTTSEKPEILENTKIVTTQVTTSVPISKELEIIKKCPLFDPGDITLIEKFIGTHKINSAQQLAKYLNQNYDIDGLCKIKKTGLKILLGLDSIDIPYYYLLNLLLPNIHPELASNNYSVKKLASILSVKNYIKGTSTIKNLGDILTILIIFKYHEFISQQDIDSINERIYLFNNIKFKSKKKENLPKEIKIAIMQNLKYIDKKVYKLSLIKEIFNKYDLITKIDELLNPDTDDLDMCDPGPDGLNVNEITNYSTIKQEKETDLFI
jgi:hypothetical protein